jgi:hypothetical protein
MLQPLAYIFQTLFQHEVFVITPTLNAGSRRHAMLVMATKASTCQEISWQKEILGSGRKNAKKSFLDGNWQEIQ